MSSKVSVVIVTYNRPDFVKKAIKSVLNQTYQNFEILVVDNGVKVSAKKIVDHFNDNRIRYIGNEKNTGCSGGKNIGAKNAKFDYVAFLDDDDIWMPEKLELQINELSKYPDAGFSYTALVSVFDDHEEISRVPDGYGDYYERSLAVFNGFLSSTLVVKKEVFEKVGYLNESFPSHTDIEFVIRVAKVYKGVSINKPLIRMEMGSAHEQMGSSFKNRIKGREMLLDMHREEFNERPKVLASHLFKLYTFYRNQGDYSGAKNTLKKAIKNNFSFLFIKHYILMLMNGKIYKTLKVWIKK